jgi:DNA-binding transcriptional MerR regulator/methylmalonyl-CoA mutase cobalamin-binding subunit
MSLRYPIRAVSKLTGISVDTLRAWERRYGVVEPERDERGRLYSEADVERLRLLRAAVQAGHAIGRVATLPTGEVKALLARGVERAEPVAANTPVDLSVLQAAVESFDGSAFRRELSRLAAVLPARTLAREVALPFMHLVGEAWHEGKLTIAQEHLVSAELRSLIGALARLHPIPEGAPRLVLATPEGDQHELGTLAAALVASGAGLGAVYLGPGLPADEVVGAARRVGARAVVLGLSGGGTASHVEAAVAAIARGLPEGVELWLGGPGAEAAAKVAGPRAIALSDFDLFEKALVRIRGG